MTFPMRVVNKEGSRGWTDDDPRGVSEYSEVIF